MPRLSVTLTDRQAEELERLTTETGATKQSMIGLAISEWLERQRAIRRQIEREEEELRRQKDIEDALADEQAVLDEMADEYNERLAKVTYKPSQAAGEHEEDWLTVVRHEGGGFDSEDRPREMGVFRGHIIKPMLGNRSNMTVVYTAQRLEGGEVQELESPASYEVDRMYSAEEVWPADMWERWKPTKR